MLIKPISEYIVCNYPDWLEIDLSPLFASQEKDFHCSFVRESDGIQIMASVKENLLHVSLSPIRSLRPDWNDEEHNGHIFDVTSEIFDAFFPGRIFVRQPDDSRRPQVKHFFAEI